MKSFEKSWIENKEKHNLARKMARGHSRVMGGFYGRDLRDIKKVVLTTAKGNRNEWKMVAKDFKKFIKVLRKKFNDLEYIGSPSLTPKSNLWHIHCFVYSKSYIPQLCLSSLWNYYHKAFVVSIAEIVDIQRDDVNDQLWYVIKHQAKNSKEIFLCGGRIMFSKGWLPEGWANEVKRLKKIAIERIDKGYGANETWDSVNKAYELWIRSERNEYA